ncbi:MAG: site-specific DNA-methyltransferase [Leptospiraceae bacterium]|nr:site-specific DNA-methyltransferase [Leptospiraceae bacterium]
MLIKGDNLLALNALVKHFENKPEEEKPKCIYIDPPYNTGSAFEHYDDNMEHSEWLTLMRDRLILLRQLLREDGTLWISVDDDESHYMKVLCDEIFGRMNFVANVVWQKKYSPQNDAKWFSDMHDHILIYAKNKEGWRPNLLSRTEEQDKAYNNPDKDPRGPWKSTDSTCNKSNIERPNLYYAMINPHTKKEIWPLESRVWRYAVSVHLEKEKDNRVWWGLDVGQTH